MPSRSKYTFTLSDDVVERVRRKSPNAKMLSRTIEALLTSGLNVFKDATIDFEMVVKNHESSNSVLDEKQINNKDEESDKRDNSPFS